MNILLTLVLAFRPMQSSTPSGYSNDPFTLAVAGPASARAGASVKVQVTVTNISQHEISLMESNPDCDYAVEVHDQSGRSVPDTNHKRQLTCSQPLHVSRRFLKTLATRRYPLDPIVVSGLSDMTRPGRYLIKVTRKIPDELGTGTVESNVISIQVTKLARGDPTRRLLAGNFAFLAKAGIGKAGAHVLSRARS